MKEDSYDTATYDKTNPESIYNYSRFLIGESLRSLLGDGTVSTRRKGKGGLGQMVEELFFKYDVNSNPEADFSEAHLELKCTPLLNARSGSALRIKERLVCSMIDYEEIAKTPFEDSHLLAKCRLMLLLFYLHVSGKDICDFRFLFRVLWQLPDKDLLLIKKDYDTIAEKVRRGEAHLISEGDTLYLGACRKGQKGDNPQPQPFSSDKAFRRAFSLKPAYMRYVLKHVIESGSDHFSNYSTTLSSGFELVNKAELQHSTFEEIILQRFKPYIGKNYNEICDMLGIQSYQSKSKYADVCGLIASDGAGKRLSDSEEFIKSGITMKTIRLRDNGMPRESMSFKNIDYYEILENDDWFESDLYELFTTRFLFVVLKPEKGKKIEVYNNRTGALTFEQSYILDKVFFWTMPPNDLETAREYWNDIKNKITANKIESDSFWSIKDHKKFHVRPKASNASDLTSNPHGGMCSKYCYWFNAVYVKQIIEQANA